MAVVLAVLVVMWLMWCNCREGAKPGPGGNKPVSAGQLSGGAGNWQLARESDGNWERGFNRGFGRGFGNYRRNFGSGWGLGWNGDYGYNRAPFAIVNGAYSRVPGFGYYDDDDEDYKAAMEWAYLRQQ